MIHQDFVRLNGMSRWTKEEKIGQIALSHEMRETLENFWHADPKTQKLFDEFSENTLSNFYMPYGVAPYFIIDNRPYIVPMVIEESSVVAAASKAAKFWSTRGGFKTTILSTTKVGQVHFLYSGDVFKLQTLFEAKKLFLKESLKDLLESMEKRGGGLLDIVLKNFSDQEKDYFQLFVTFETCNAMGANFINSCLERLALAWKECVALHLEGDITIVMSILSNYTPDCRVRTEVSCSVEELGADYVAKFMKAISIARLDPYRAVTHNKGIFNGIDAVVLATGNDFRAVEAGGHAYAARDGHYRSLTQAFVEDDLFIFRLEIPMALGTVGGLTTLHPLAKLSLQLLGDPSSKDLMRIVASVGLAQNFGAVHSLITTGIQKGHMKMHLMNILNSLGASDEERLYAQSYFQDKVISFKDVRDYIALMRRPQ